MTDENQPTNKTVYPRAVLETTEGPVAIGPLSFRPKTLSVRVEIRKHRHINILAHDNGRIEISFPAGRGGDYLIKSVASNCFDLIPADD